MNKGFVIMAQGDDYVKCAEVLRDSIYNTMPNANVTIITTDMLPYGDQAPDTDWKLQNDWQVYEASPYEYTIKLEADMYLPQSIDYWWDVLKDHDVIVSSHIRNFKQEISEEKYYRNFTKLNDLPDVYNALTYFRKSEKAERFFAIVRDIFENWDQYLATLQTNVDEPCTTDWAYCIACHIMGVEETTLPDFTDFSMIHMKQFVNPGLLRENWTEGYSYEIKPNVLRVNTVPQMYPFHYHIKSFCDIIREHNG